MKKLCKHREHKEQGRAAEKLTINLCQTDYQWLSLYFLGDWGLFKMQRLVLPIPQNFLSHCPWCQRPPGLWQKIPSLSHKAKLSPCQRGSSEISLLEDLARTLRPPGQQDLLRLWHMWYVNLRQHACRSREILFPAWLLWQLLVKHLVIKGLHVLPKSFGKEKQNLYLVLFQMWSYKLLLCSIK